ncbi:hypothetical protein [Desulfosarcina sp.]|uniref:hypothetical protein n=1 Tax=Desulfosarcina sp. TaxID=2027861 RepID=UPI0039705E3B
MKTPPIFAVVFLIAVVFFSPVLATETSSAESTGPDEALVKAYLEKKAPGDTGSCLTEHMKMEIVGISDVMPGHQAEVFYKFEYKLRCNRGSESKSGQGVLHAARLRDGNWIDRETFAIINK